jgi:hypothetical protein
VHHFIDKLQRQERFGSDKADDDLEKKSETLDELKS